MGSVRVRTTSDMETGHIALSQWQIEDRGAGIPQTVESLVANHAHNLARLPGRERWSVGDERIVGTEILSRERFIDDDNGRALVLLR